MSGECGRSRSVASNMEVDALLTGPEHISAQGDAKGSDSDVESDAFVPPPRGLFLYVEVPPRPSTRREIEAPIILSDDDDTDVEERGQPVEIVGEHRINRVRHFFVLFEDNVIRMVCGYGGVYSVACPSSLTRSNL